MNSDQDNHVPSPEIAGAVHEPTPGTPDITVLRNHGRPAPVLPLHIFGSIWGKWIAEAASAAACPADYVVAALLPAASAVIGNARWAQVGLGWKEPPHLWCAAVGESGQGKSPGADVIYSRVIPSIESSMALEHSDRLGELHAKVIQATMRHERGTEGLGMFTRPLLESAEQVDRPTPRFLLNDVTIEKVAAVVAEAAPKGLLMSRDELSGWLLGMGAYNSAARAFWIETYGGRRYRVDRVGRPEPIIVPHLAVAWHGGIQPARLAQVMRDADDGLLARFCWLWPDPVKFKLTKAAPDADFAIRAFERLRMLDLAPPTGPGLAAEPIFVPLADEAHDDLEKFAQDMQDMQNVSGGLLASAFGKARGLTLRLSLVLEYLAWAAEDGTAAAPEGISRTAFLAATALVRDYFLPMAERVYGDAATTPQERNTAVLARWIAKTKPTDVHVRTVQREVRLPGLVDAEAIHAACKALVDAGWLESPPRGSREGRARAAYAVRPELWAALK
jgi:hypothetical protein